MPGPPPPLMGPETRNLTTPELPTVNHHLLSAPTPAQVGLRAGRRRGRGVWWGFAGNVWTEDRYRYGDSREPCDVFLGINGCQLGKFELGYLLIL